MYFKRLRHVLNMSQYKLLQSGSPNHDIHGSVLSGLGRTGPETFPKLLLRSARPHLSSLATAQLSLSFPSALSSKKTSLSVWEHGCIT